MADNSELDTDHLKAKSNREYGLRTIDGLLLGIKVSAATNFSHKTDSRATAEHIVFLCFAVNWKWRSRALLAFEIVEIFPVL